MPGALEKQRKVLRIAKELECSMGVKWRVEGRDVEEEAGSRIMKRACRHLDSFCSEMLMHWKGLRRGADAF